MIQELYINNQLVDLLPNTRIILNKDFVDLQNPDARISDASLRLKLPKSKKNNIIFGHINVENIVDKFVRLEDFEALYLVNGVIVHNGTFRILSVDEDGYSGVLLTGVASWSKLLTGKTLRDLKNNDLLTPWSIPFTGLDYTGSNTPYSLNWYINNNSFINSDVTFPLLSYGTFWSSYITNNQINEIHTDSLSLENFPPAVYDLKIIKRIFQNIGWTVESSLFSDSEAQKVFIPYTTSDSYIWNYGLLADQGASGSTFSVGSNFNTSTFYGDIRNEYVYTSADVNKKCIEASFLNFPIFYKNPFLDFKNYSFQGFNGNTQITGYQTKMTKKYSFDIDINNWFFEILGKASVTFVEFNGNTVYICNNSPLADEIAKSSGYNLGYARAGFLIYIDTPDNADLPFILENLNTYVYNFYYDNSNPNLEINHPSVLAAYVPTNSGVTSSYFFPYDPTADIVVTGNTTLQSFQPISLAYPPNFPNPNVASLNQRTYSWKWTGNTQFQFRNINIPNGYVIKALVFGPGISPDSTLLVNIACSVSPFPSLGMDLSKEIGYNYSASSINFTFFPADDESDVDLNLAKNLPDIGQLDYVKSWINRYNLFINTDFKDKKVTFETYNNYFLPNDFTYDLSGKFNNNFYEPKSEPVILPKIIQLFYNNDSSDALVSKDFNYGSVRIQNDNIYCEGQKDISNLFSSTKLREFKFIEMNSYVNLNLPSICDTDRFLFSDLTQVELDYTNSPRILKLTGEYQKNNEGSAEIVIPVNGVDIKILTSIFEENDPNKLSLSYYGDYGLYNKFFERYLNEISDSYIITMDCYITPTDWQNLTQNVPVIINGQAYIIYKIRNYDPLNNGKAQISFIRKYTN